MDLEERHTLLFNVSLSIYMKKSSNSRVLDSQKRIGQAMIELLKFETYKKITVTQLIQYAEVSRKTFYRNFDDKDDVVDYLLNNVFQEFLDRVLQIPVLSNHEITICYFEIWYSSSELLKVLMKKDLVHFLYKFHNDKINKLYKMFYCSYHKDKGNYWNNMIIGTYFSVLEQWTTDNFSMLPSDAANLYTSTIKNLATLI